MNVSTKFGHLHSVTKSIVCSCRVEALSAPVFTTRHKSSAAPQIKLEENDISNYNEATPFESIPGPPSLPFFGNWFSYRFDPGQIHRRHIYLQGLKDKYGDIVKEKLASETIVHLFSPKYVRQIYDNEGKYPIIPPLLPSVKLYRQSREMSPGLGNSNGEEWYRLRAVVQQELVRPQKALDYLPLQNEIADSFLDKLDSLINEKREVENLNRWIYRWGLESSVYTFLEKKMGYFEDSGLQLADEVIDCIDGVFELATKIFYGLPVYNYLPSPSLKKLFEYEDFINSNSRKLLNQASKEYRDDLEGRTASGKRFLFLSYILANKSISDKDVFSVVNSILTDSLSTTSQALLSNLYQLASHPEAQEKAYQEALTILPPSGEMTAEAFNSSPYIKGCMKETFRFMPVGIDVQRYCPLDMAIGGYQIPAGTSLALNTHLPLHDPAYIPNPEAFAPERWVRGNELFFQTHPFVMLPFSVGTRMCAGRRFAEQELVMLIVKILKRYKLEWHYGPVSHRHRLLQVPDQEIKVKFIPREG